MSELRLLTIRVAGLAAVVLDNPSWLRARRADVLFPAVERLCLELCRHNPILSFRTDQLIDVNDLDQQFSLVAPRVRNFGCLRLDNLDVSIEDACPDGSLPLCVEASYAKLLQFDDLTRGLGEVSKYQVDQWYETRKISSRLQLVTGRLGSRLITEKEWGIGKLTENPPPTKMAFNTVLRYELWGPADTQTVIVKASRPKGGSEIALTLAPGAELTISNLCAFDPGVLPKPHFLDVLAFYELSKKAVSADERCVLHNPMGGKTRPHTDACPPATAFTVPVGADGDAT